MKVGFGSLPLLIVNGDLFLLIKLYALHTVDYRDFSDFSQRFQKGLEPLLKVPEIGINWMTAVGIRYVNLVVTEEQTLTERLFKFVDFTCGAPKIRIVYY